MEKNFAKEYFQIAKSLSQVIDDVSLLTEDCDKLALKSSFGDNAAMRLKALGMPLAEALAALTDAAHLEDSQSAESWLTATDEEIGMDESDVDSLEEDQYTDDSDDAGIEVYDTLSEFIEEQKDKSYKVMNCFFDHGCGDLMITLRYSGNSHNDYFRVTEHGLKYPIDWFGTAGVNSDGYKANGVAECLISALTSGDLGYIGGGSCDGAE